MENCVFCNIASKKISSSVVYEDKNVLAFLDIMPANKGHCLIIPKNHCENITEMNSKDMSAMMEASKKVAKAVSLACGSSSFNLVMNNGKDSGQIVMHAHMHVIPRFEKDRLRIKWSHKRYELNEMSEFAEKIKKFV